MTSQRADRTTSAPARALPVDLDRTEEEPAVPTRRSRAAGVLVLGAVSALGVLVVAALVGGAAAPAALADPGAFTRWGLLVSRTVYDVTAIGALGVLVVAVLLLPRADDGFGPDAARLVRTVTWWAGAWSATALLTAVLTLSKVAGAPVAVVLAPDVLALALDLEQTRSLLSTAWLAALVAVGARITRSPATGVLLLLTAGGALVLPLLTGHAGHGEFPAVTAASLALHVTGAAVWVGGLGALVVHLRRAPIALAVVMPRYSRVALACFVTVALSGALTGWASLDAVDELWTTAYGQLLLGKAAALAALGVFGHRHRARTVAAVVARRPRAFLGLAGAELVLMTCAAALAVALSHTAPPPGTGAHPTASASPVAVERALR